MTLVNPASWTPRGVTSLEPNAWKALRAEENVCVIAGPGAGKTEFLAQRATYLLETWLCPSPNKILAISFKTDAAENLAARVKQRCAPALAHRFVSLTFDAFTKSLVDRFVYALPEHWRPQLPYDVVFPARRDIEVFLDRTRLSAQTGEWQAEIASLQAGTFEPKTVGSTRLPARPPDPKSGSAFAVVRWWQEHLRRRNGPSHLSFVMLNRLAELLVRTNQEVARALRTTYRFVFVDEFQDTTYAQYDFLLSVLSGPKITLTTVGDNKQRIMVWAGARPDIFLRFKEDFHAQEIPLLFNFRSSPGLVRIQQIVAAAIEAGTPQVISQAAGHIEGDVAQVWRFESMQQEAAIIAQWLTADMARRKTGPRDYCLLVRQTADRFEKQLSQAFAQQGLHLRNESKQIGRTTLQDLLGERFSSVCIALLRLAVTKRDPESWSIAADAMERLRAVDPDDAVEANRVATELTAFVKSLRKEIATSKATILVDKLVDTLVSFSDIRAWKQTSPEYGTGDKLGIVIEAFTIHLRECLLSCASVAEALDEFEGLQQVPLMTVHKSKGLEYDTMMFVGLDDDSWWSHTPSNPDGLATFFVALSRAKQRALFTFCSQRGDRKKVADLYSLLRAANVPEVTTWPQLKP
jgi:superfamily I DNA/RNA helicase